MKPIGPMMREHRLIERMLRQLGHELDAINTRHTTDPVFIETAVDFFRTYADRTHHGKEEEIYFRGTGAQGYRSGSSPNHGRAHRRARIRKG